VSTTGPVTDPRVRPSRPADAGRVRPLIAALQEFERALDGRLRRGAEIADTDLAWMLARADETGGAVLAAEHDGTIAGMASLFARVPCGYFDEVPYEYALLDDLVVEEALRGRGIGRALTAEAERRVASAGVRWLRIAVPGRNREARRLHRPSGYEAREIILEKTIATRPAPAEVSS